MLKLKNSKARKSTSKSEMNALGIILVQKERKKKMDANARKFALIRKIEAQVKTLTLCFGYMLMLGVMMRLCAPSPA